MKGHQPLIAMRKAGICPQIVFINDFPCQTDWHDHGDHVTICVHGDVIQTLDMRFLVGMAVSVSGSTETRSKALLAKARASGAKKVAAVHAFMDGNRIKSGWTEIWEKQSG